jgi:single-stranded DNA-binding protein
MAVATGRLKTEKWEKDGGTRYELLLICEALHFIPAEQPSGAGLEDPEPVAATMAKGTPASNKNGAPPF